MTVKLYDNDNGNLKYSN